MRPLTPLELKEIVRIEQAITRNTDSGLTQNLLRIVIPQAKNELWLNILALAKAKSEELNGSAITAGD